ncbi:AAA family ATPase [Paenibacillus sp. D9]|uniref:AAA family ATPase n=1 Tax=Paenibacillus TaxID=44249 RepID=UPI0006760BFC|nr:ATP-binding protein [Paenibacillus sp. D9]
MSKSAAASRLPRSKGTDIASYYSPKDCGRKVRRIVLQPENNRIVEEFIRILDMKEKFEEHDVPIPNKIVMFGPPGTGKTLTAFYMAQRLNVPLLLVRLDSVIHSHLGETATNLRKIFDHARSSPCVLFLDEFDAIARTRENNDEVKEMTRVVNTLLQCLDEFDGSSVFMAATNLEKDLDRAIWRRFDTKMRYDSPNRASREAYLSQLLGDFPGGEELLEPASQMLEGCSFADMEQIVLKAKRKAIIEEASISLPMLEDSYSEYKPRLLERLEAGQERSLRAGGWR